MASGWKFTRHDDAPTPTVSRSAGTKTIARGWGWAILTVVMLGGCASSEIVKLRPISSNPLDSTLKLISHGGPQPTERTIQYLRRNDLLNKLDGDAQVLLTDLHEILRVDPSPDGCQAYAEIAYLEGLKQQRANGKLALDYFGASVAHSYYYLFDPRFAQFRNPYDPQFRQECDLYNEALESALKIVQKEGQLRPDMQAEIEVAGQKWQIQVQLRNGQWNPAEIEKFEFVSDYQVTGLRNHYHTYGLGVPLIAVRKPPATSTTREKYFPPGLSFPLTAFLRLLPDEHGSHAHQQPQAGTTCNVHRAVLDLYDPLTSSDITVCDRQVPLETDLSTPLAHFLSNPQLGKLDASTSGLLNPGSTEELAGLYLLEPYNPDKIPVVFVHGLWSSPITWMEMFNDLQGSADLRSRYQFLFYFYPTGQPFWYSATRFRGDLRNYRQTFDPQSRQPAMEQMVLIGHSMGGLVSRLQVIDSEDRFWKILSDKPFDGIVASEKYRAELRELFFFQPNPAIKRIVTIGTPHLGSEFSNDYTQVLARRLIKLPEMLSMRRHELIEKNPGLIRDPKLLEITTSIDSLSPNSPILPVMFQARRAPWVKHDNIVGLVPRSGIYRYSSPGDGIVELTSASIEQIKTTRFAEYVRDYQVEREVTVAANHVDIHRHPKSVATVRRILLEHIQQANMQPNPWLRKEPVPQTAEQPGTTQPASLLVPAAQESASYVDRGNTVPVNTLPGDAARPSNLAASPVWSEAVAWPNLGVGPNAPGGYATANQPTTNLQVPVGSTAPPGTFPQGEQAPEIYGSPALTSPGNSIMADRPSAMPLYR
ncbi:MAG: hypothetical protein SFX18_16875 [Pirellulales bacterium]|nr:hypothetical protein [Pirellulales bacterium]